jgi:hypothetical protein
LIFRHDSDTLSEELIFNDYTHSIEECKAGEIPWSLPLRNACARVSKKGARFKVKVEYKRENTGNRRQNTGGRRKNERGQRWEAGGLRKKRKGSCLYPQASEASDPPT